MDNSKKENSSVSKSNDCPYCQAMKQENPELDSLCPYCADMNNENIEECKYCVSMEENPENGCPYCAAMEVESPLEPHVKLPTTQDSQNYAGQGLNEPDIVKPMPGDEPPIGLGSSMDVPTNTNEKMNTQEIPNQKISKESLQLDHSKEALQEIAQQIEGSDSQGSLETAKEIDSTDMAVGTEMDGNVSRPAGYETNSPVDMGIGEEGHPKEGPDLTSLLHEGLDVQANDIQREKVIQMVSEALQGFKASKEIIERAQEQAPQLYQSSIMMLKAMIEMARMLGLSGDVQANPENPMDNATKQNGNEWHKPFATHPDQGGEMKSGHADSSGESKVVGQGIGKLPTSATTPHVARTPLAPGAINDQGQMKYVDQNTGKESFINMREGRVLNEQGKPVIPPKR